MKDSQFITEFQMSDRAMLKVHLKEFVGQRYVDIRAYETRWSGAYLSTPKGFELRVELIPELIGALQKAEKALNE